jgi:hypothetical protein
MQNISNSNQLFWWNGRTKEMLMLSGKQHLLALLLVALVLVPLSFFAENFNIDANVRTVDKQVLTSELANPTTPVYVEVLSRDRHSAECSENHKVVAELASEYRGRIKFLRVYIEEVPDAESILGVHGTPSGVLVVPDTDPAHRLEIGQGHPTYSLVEGFGSRLRLKQLFEKVMP